MTTFFCGSSLAALKTNFHLFISGISFFVEGKGLHNKIIGLKKILFCFSSFGRIRTHFNGASPTLFKNSLVLVVLKKAIAKKKIIFFLFTAIFVLLYFSLPKIIHTNTLHIIIT